MREHAGKGNGPLEEREEEVLDGALFLLAQGDAAPNSRTAWRKKKSISSANFFTSNARRAGIAEPSSARVASALDPHQDLHALLVQRQARGRSRAFRTESSCIVSPASSRNSSLAPGSCRSAAGTGIPALRR